MRKDEFGMACPSTLGEYRDLCAAFGTRDCAAVKLLDEKISESERGRDEIVIQPDSQMRGLLMPLLVTNELPERAK